MKLQYICILAVIVLSSFAQAKVSKCKALYDVKPVKVKNRFNKEFELFNNISEKKYLDIIEELSRDDSPIAPDIVTVLDGLKKQGYKFKNGGSLRCTSCTKNKTNLLSFYTLKGRYYNGQGIVKEVSMIFSCLDIKTKISAYSYSLKFLKSIGKF